MAPEGVPQGDIGCPGLINKMYSENDIGDLIGQSENHHWKGDSRVEDDLSEVVK